MRYQVGFRPHAEADLLRLYRYIVAEAGHSVAGEYIERIEAACLSLESFPHRGTRRDHLGAGIRTIGFERRATIVFRVEKRKVVIVRILHGGRDLERALTSAQKR